MLLQRDSEKIRRDAIATGIKKAKNQCLSCADGYFELAREHGATEEEIKLALEEAAQRRGQNLSRRDLIKVLAASGITLATAGLLTGTAHADQFGDWYGTDSNTRSLTSGGLQQDFYIGRMGQALDFDTNSYAFNRAAAADTKPRQGGANTHSFGYWAVHGPQSGNKPSNLTNYQWGAAQADKAYDAWWHCPNQDLIGGATIFGQVEPETAGWISGVINNNRDVVNGFMDELFTIVPENTWPGLYITPNNWQNILEPDFHSFRTNTNFVLWMSGLDTCGSDICAPCAACATQPTVHNRFQNFLNNGVNLGSMVPVVWQYWISGGYPCGSCGDFDVTRQDTDAFTPVIVQGAAAARSAVDSALQRRRRNNPKMKKR